MLKVNEINLFYGSIHTLRDISFQVCAGEIVSLIGANGAGKSSILNAISGLVPIASGDILFQGQSIRKTPAFRLVSRGLAQVPEGRRVFARMSVMENLEMGAFTRQEASGIRDDLEMVFDHFPRLKERRKQAAGTLSGGEQQMLAMGRGLMSSPKLLLLDEPSMGLAPILVEEIFRFIQEINKRGTTILLVEQNAHLALEISHQACVLETGQIALAGSAAEVAADGRIQEIYLGAG